MPQPEIRKDPETQRVLREGQVLADLVKSAAWGLVKRKMNKLLLDLGNILTIDNKTADPVKELAARQMAIGIIMELVKEIEGDAAQFSDNSEYMKNFLENDFVLRIEEPEKN